MRLNKNIDLEILLTATDRRYLRECEAVVVDVDRGIVAIPSTHLSVRALSFQELLNRAFHADTALALKLLIAAEDKAENALELHRCYEQAIITLYKARAIEHYLNLCVEYCYKDIANTESVRKENENMRLWAPVYTYERLAIIYEKQGNIEEAIKICELAIQYGLRDSAKRGFEGRIERLRRKLSTP